MSLSPGVKLGHYEVGAPIGAGGMGQVYKAVDFRLGRQVAIKVCRRSSRPPERLSRSAQEARAAAALNHPHIAAVYDTGPRARRNTSSRIYLDGAPLRARLTERRDRPIAEWLPIASDIASALATAHQTGIVHRDIKPENIMVSPDGRAKVQLLDAICVVASRALRLRPLGAAMSKVRRHTPRSHHGGEDNMTTSRISAVAIALSIAFGFVGDASSTQRSAKDQNLSGTIASSKRMADGKEWTTANLNVNTSSSYCYDDAEPNCRRYGRLYTWESAQRGCQSLGDGWRLPTDDEWRQMATHYGGLGNDSPGKGKAAYTALLSGGTSGFNAVLGGNRSIDGQYDRLEAHGIYWTASENDSITAPLYNFGKGSQALYRGPQGQKQMAVSVRCVRE